MVGPITLEPEIRPFSNDDFAAVRNLYRIVWGEERDLRYDRMRMTNTVRGTCTAVVAMIAGRCVGFYMVWPLPLTDGKSLVSGAQPIDTMTDPEFQGRGLLGRMGCECYRLCAESGLKVMFGAPNRAAYPGNLGRLNWSHTGDIRLYARPLTLAGMLPGGRLAGMLARALPLQARKDAEVRLEAPSSSELEECLASMHYPQRTWRVARSLAWFRYRYQEAGRLTYTWISIYRGGSLFGFSIVGIPTGSSARSKLASLSEVVGRDREGRRLAVGAAVSFARRQGANAVTTRSTSSLLADALRTNGFIAVRRSPLITRVLGPDCFDANPFVPRAWELFGGDFDIL
jgi:hypothetical protein